MRRRLDGSACYDVAWCRGYWKRTAEFLGERDLFGELTKAVQEDGLFVMARMDSNGAGEDHASKS